MKKIYLLISLAVGLVSSCDMDTVPFGSIPESDALVTPEDFTGMRNGLYSGLRSSVGGSVFYITPDVQTDEFHALIGNSNTYGDMYRWDFTPQSANISAAYANYQAIIARSNFIIDGYNKCDFSDASIFDEEGMKAVKDAKGDAFFTRAYSIFMLSQFFCADYEAATANEPNTGVSYRTDYAPSADPATYPARKTLAETYAQVKADLDSAAIYITTRGAVRNNYISVDAITALRARVALAMDDYNNAAQYASSLADSRTYSLAGSANDLINLWTNDSGNETILQLIIGAADQLASGCGTAYQPVDRDPDFIPTQDLINLYSNDDYRKSVYFNTINVTTTTGASGTVYAFNKFPIETKLYQSMQSPESRSVIEPKVFRIAEMYLIAAEAYAQAGNIEKGTYYLNQLESKRIKNYQAQTFSSKQDLMNEIMRERQREMLGEGSRLIDIKRWHISMTRGAAQQEDLLLTPGPTTTYLSRPADADRLTWPIPKNETDLTDRIVQNPGY